MDYSIEDLMYLNKKLIELYPDDFALKSNYEQLQQIRSESDYTVDA
jgi:hypothetical protein